MINSGIYDGVVDRIKNVFGSCSESERKQLITILEEISKYGDSYTLENIYLTDFKEVPLSIDEFIKSPYYLGATNRNGESVYPFWKETFSNIFNNGNKYNEIILSGATRLGKTSSAVTMAAYMLYRLMLYRNPHEYFHKKEISKFTIAFANLTKDLAYGVAYREYQDTLKECPWFQEHGTFSRSDRNFYYIPEGGKIDIVAGSDSSNFLGMQIWCAIMDETNFAKSGVKDINIAKAHMKNLYDTINARVSGTFRLGGEVYGKLIASSSKNSDNDFLSDHIEKQISSGNSHLYLVDEPQWKVLPPSMFSDKKFHFTVGDRYKKGFVIPEEEDDEEHRKDYESQGYRVIEAPAEFRKNFLADYDISLRDIAGISVVGAMGYITQDIIDTCISQDRVNPFFYDVIEIGKKDSQTIEEYFHLDKVPAELKRYPMCIHLDMAEVNDRSGISGVCVPENKIIENEEGKKISMPFVKHIFSIGIQTPRGDRQSFQKIINFIIWLRSKGFNIGVVSADQYQSSYVLETLDQQGFETAKISVDRSMDPYKGLRALFIDQRIDLLRNNLLEDELVNLKRMNNKFDHDPDGCFTPDTKVRLVDGRSLSISELMIEQEYKTNYVYTVNEKTNEIEPKPIKKVFQTKIVKHLVEVVLDNGEVIRCTPEHRFMLRDGSYEQARNLEEGISLMPLYTRISKNYKGYRECYDPFKDDWFLEHHLFSGNQDPTKVIHHCNFDKLNNIPSNLKIMTKGEHISLHNRLTRDYSKISKGVRDYFRKIRGTDKERDRSRKISESVLNHYRSIYGDDYIPRYIQSQNRISCIEDEFNVDWNNLTDSEKTSYGLLYSNKQAGEDAVKLRYEAARAKVSDESEKNRRSKLSKKMKEMKWFSNGSDNIYIDPRIQPIPEGYKPGRILSADHLRKIRSTKRNVSDELRSRLSKATSNKIWVTDGSTDKYINKDEHIPDGFRRGRCKIGKNHKVVEVREIIMPSKVYDIEVEDNHNFALDSGVFVHNSKDVSDSLCGACWSAITSKLAPQPNRTSMAKVAVAVNTGKSKVSTPSGNFFRSPLVKR